MNKLKLDFLERLESYILDIKLLIEERPKGKDYKDRFNYFIDNFHIDLNSALFNENPYLNQIVQDIYWGLLSMANISFNEYSKFTLSKIHMFEEEYHNLRIGYINLL
ncbi:MAG: hypothetical protein WC471_05170 [Candidatus Woesearchaeota archaeon]